MKKSKIESANLTNYGAQLDTSSLVKMHLSSTYVTTRDGKKLFTIIMKPQSHGRFPIVLKRGAYQSAFDVPLTFENFLDLHPILNYNIPDINDFISNGYTFIYQHCRGTGNSDGKFVHALSEFDDGCDTMDWIRQQDFYNGEVFRYGASYTGFTAIVDAHMHHEDVKGIVVNQPNTFHYEVANRNGFFKTGLLGGWPAQMDGFYGRKPVNFNYDVFRTFPQKDWGKLILGHPDTMLDIEQAHPDERDPYWRSVEGLGHDFYKSMEELDTPTLFRGGLFDLFCEPMLHIWNNVIPEETRKKSTFVMSPYCHTLREKREHWPFEMAGAIMSDTIPHFAVNWFNHIRTGEPLEHLRLNQVAFFPECGQKVWYFEEGKFTNGEGEHTLYLNESLTLDNEPGAVSETTYLYNPYNPAVFYGGADHNVGVPRPGYEHIPGVLEQIVMMPQDPPNWRYDVISFEAKPFEDSITIKGDMGLDLYVKSDCEDTCFYARLCFVKDGVTYGIRDDITSLCYQLGNYSPGEEVKLHFNFSSIIWDVKPGDQLRLDISSSCYPHYSLHTNVKGNQSQVEKPKYANNTVVFGKSNFTYHTCDSLAEKFDSVVVENKDV